jgi:hypothetical protein
MDEKWRGFWPCVEMRLCPYKIAVDGLEFVRTITTPQQPRLFKKIVEYGTERTSASAQRKMDVHKPHKHAPPSCHLRTRDFGQLSQPPDNDWQGFL